MAKKSLAQIIGEIIAGIRLGKQLSIERDLQAAEGWNQVTAENRANTIRFIKRVKHRYYKKSLQLKVYSLL